MTDEPTRTPTQAPAVTGALSFDAQEYLHFLEDCDWTEDQKREFIEALWQIIVGFVDMGFDLHPIQQVMDSPKTLEVDSGGVLDSISKQEFFQTKDTGLDRLVGAGGPDS